MNCGNIRRFVFSGLDSHWAEALDIVFRVSNETTATLQGSPGGPFATEPLIVAVIASTTPPRYSGSVNLLERVLETPYGHRYYTDLASYRLHAARLAVKGGQEAVARAWWNEACRLLLGYGFRKDTTLWELLDPITTLASIDPEET